MAILVLLNGPNLNLLGSREPAVYGTDTLKDVEDRLAALATARGHRLIALQSNAEHELVDQVHQAARDGVDFMLVNAGALTHTSIALRDALLGVGIPFIEIHISNVFAREEYRHHSFLSDIAVGSIVGLGVHGYELGLEAALRHLER